MIISGDLASQGVFMLCTDFPLHGLFKHIPVKKINNTYAFSNKNETIFCHILLNS